MVEELCEVEFEHPSKYSEGLRSSNTEFASEKHSLPNNDFVACYSLMLQ